MTMPSTSPIAHPVRQCSVADAASPHDTDAHPRAVASFPCRCSCMTSVSFLVDTDHNTPWGYFVPPPNAVTRPDEPCGGTHVPARPSLHGQRPERFAEQARPPPPGRGGGVRARPGHVRRARAGEPARPVLHDGAAGAGPVVERAAVGGLAGGRRRSGRGGGARRAH